jgi:putative endopeptidase
VHLHLNFIICSMVKPLSFAALLALVACSGSDKNYQALHLEYMDSSVNPADDFYNFVNGRWMKSATIPADKGRWGAFEQLDSRTDSMTLAVLEDALSSKKYAAGTDQGKAVSLFATAMDTVSRNKQGTSPLKKYLDEINKIENTADLNAYITHYMPYGENSLLGISVGADAKNSNKNSVYVYPPGLGLPERDYYMKTDEKSVDLQKKYRAFVSSMLVEYGYDQKEADADATTIYEFEKTLATAMLTKEKRREPQLQYNPYSVADANKLVSNLDFPAFYGILHIKPDTVIITEPAYAKAVNQLVNGNNLGKIKAYMRWGTIRSTASMLSDKIEKLSFDFYGKTMRGTPAQKPRKERALDVVNGSLGEALGQLYVDKYFPAEAKTKAKELVDDLMAAYRIRINGLDWMGAETKKKALKKLDKLTIKIGYPDKWRDYSKLQIKTYADGGSYLENMMNAASFEVQRNMAKFGKPVDKTEWGMSPQTVNAYYNPQYNEIVFPAAILQAPFFDFRADAAVNYGGIGAVIGHEISHGFDDQGSQYDEDGNLVNWWTEDDLKKFQAKGALLAAQYNGFEALPGKFVNGAFTMGENIGDLGGVYSAYEALGIYLKRTSENEKIDGYTPQQRFFLSWGTIWRNKIRDEELSMRLMTDPHSPGYFRAMGPLQNHDGFYQAFNVKPGNKMYRPDSVRVKIW